MLVEGNKEQSKRNISNSLLRELVTNESIIISVQVLSELYNTLRNKYAFSDNEVQNKLKELIKVVSVKDVTISTINNAWEICNNYNISYYDSVIIASALESNCVKIYTEDLQHNQVFENQLTVVNPYL